MRKMLSKILIFSSLITLCLGTPRIVNGEEAAEGEFPYMVSLREFNNHICGASILNELFVLTAAHCVQYSSPSSLSILYGVTQISRDENIIQVLLVSAHPDYNVKPAYYNDVAVLKLTTPLKYDRFVQPVILPPARNATPELSSAELIGWGLPCTGGAIMIRLQKVKIMVYSDLECEILHSGTGPTNSKYQICAGVPKGGKGQCNGDAGGPLTVNRVQVGIASWSMKPCGLEGYPGVFAKVSTYVPWILEQMKRYST